MNWGRATSNRLVSLGIYLGGVALAVAGALGLSGAIDLSTWVAGPLLIVGLAVVVAVHEYLGGPAGT